MTQRRIYIHMFNHNKPFFPLLVSKSTRTTETSPQQHVPFNTALDLDKSDDLFSLSCWSLSQPVTWWEAGAQEPWSGCHSVCQSVTEHTLHSPTHSPGGKLASPNENVFGLWEENIQTLSLNQCIATLPWTFHFNGDAQLAPHQLPIWYSALL